MSMLLPTRKLAKTGLRNPTCLVSADAMAKPMAIVLDHYRAHHQVDDPLSTCLAMLDAPPPPVAAALETMTPEWRDHAVACVYALLMPHATRKRMGAYFTPPHLVDHLLDRLSSLGVVLALERFHDPAAGGAAFIVPLARRLTQTWLAAGSKREAVVGRLSERLSGTEIDSSLAALANELIRRMLRREFGFSAKMTEGLSLIRTGDSLADDRLIVPHRHEIGNPPYRRLSADEHCAATVRFKDIASGRMNLYTMFVRCGLDNVPVGGTVSHVVPASFLSGPEFRAFRQRVQQLADIEVLDLVEARESVFLDALQDACFLILRKKELGDSVSSETPTSTGVFCSDGSAAFKRDIVLPVDGSPWPLPGEPTLDGVTLVELGYRVGVGYLVAGRQSHLLHSKPGPSRYPLVWAKAIAGDGTLDHAKGAKHKGHGWAAPPNGAGVVREACVVLQRTSSRAQRRRVCAATVTSEFIREHGGFVAENHVLVLTRTRADAPSPEHLVDLLNSPAVNDAVARASGSVSISATLLSSIQLPFAKAKWAAK